MKKLLIFALILIPGYMIAQDKVSYKKQTRSVITGKIKTVDVTKQWYQHIKTIDSFKNVVPIVIPPIVTDPNIFDVIYKMDWENTPLGAYKRSQQEKNWNGGLYEWGLGDRSDINDYQNVNIIQEGANKYMRATYLKGKHGWESGFSWEGELGAMYDEVYLSYNVRFNSGFEYANGGKFPGLGGGDMNTGVFYCNLPLNERKRFGFDGVAMWNDYGSIDSYIYHHNCINADGWAEGGRWDLQLSKITQGKWFNVTIRMVINDVGKANGIYEAFVDGKLVFSNMRYNWREDDNIKIHKIIFHSFFGGSDPALKDEYIDFDDITAYTYKLGVDVPRGKKLSPDGRVIIHP